MTNPPTPPRVSPFEPVTDDELRGFKIDEGDTGTRDALNALLAARHRAATPPLPVREPSERVDWERVAAWMRDANRKPAVTAFTAGPERQLAYAFEDAAAPVREDEGREPLWQKCPVCCGTGLVSTPAGVAGDQPTFMSTSTGPWQCRVCAGLGVLTQHLAVAALSRSRPAGATSEAKQRDLIEEACGVLEATANDSAACPYSDEQEYVLDLVAKIRAAQRSAGTREHSEGSNG